MNAAVWLYDNGIRVFPIKPRDKEPACASWDDYTCDRYTVSRFVNYGVALGALAVADSDTPAVETWVAAQLPDTPFKVTTARGRHRYYRLAGDAPHYFHRDTHTIEFRHAGQYVVGPGSIHLTGVIYTPDDWSWRIEDIPFFPVADFQFDDRPLEARGSADGQPFVLPSVVQAGERHETMFKLMRSLQARGVELDGLLAACHAENLLVCSPPIERQELDSYIRRVSKTRDRAGFSRAVQTEGVLAGGLIEVGVSVESTILAVKSVYPTFDPLTDSSTCLCQRCGYRWPPRTESPRICPACKSENWRYARITNQGRSVAAVLDAENQPLEPISENQPPSSVESLQSVGKLLEQVYVKPPDTTVETLEILQSLSKLRCLRCRHEWTARKPIPPKTCPACRSTRWQIEKVMIDAYGHSTNRADYDVAPSVAEPDTDIYDPDTLEIVGRLINGIPVWRDAK